MKLIKKIKSLFARPQATRVKKRHMLITFKDGDSIGIEVRSIEHAQRLLNKFNWLHIHEAGLLNGAFINYKADGNGIFRAVSN